MMWQRQDDALPVRLYRRALVILPGEFRRRYAEGMASMFADEWRERRGLARGALLAKALFDMLRTAAIERISGSGRRHEKEAGMRPSKTGGVSWLDVKLGLRMLVKHPALTLAGGLGMAVAVAISVGFFSFTTAYIYPTLPLDEGERVVALANRDLATNDDERRSLHDFFTWREELESFEDLAAFRTVERNLITGDGPPQLVQVAEMTAAGFRVARVPPRLGRYLLEEDERVGSPPVVVIGYDVWQSRFAGDPTVIGRDIRLGATMHTVVGIMPENFAFPKNHRFWTPLLARPSDYERREGPAIFIFGRLAPGVTMEQAQTELSAIGRRTAAEFPETHVQLSPLVVRYVHSLTGTRGITLSEIIQGQLMISLLLVVVALNVAVLIYARTAARQGEIVVRSALGASRSRLVAQLFAEALVLSAGAAALGFTLARVGMGMGNRLIAVAREADAPFWMDYSIRPGTVLLTVGLALLAAVVTGVLPALQATGPRFQSELRQHGTGMRLGRTWTTLVVAQIAVAVAVLPAAVNKGWTEIRGGLTESTYPAEEFAVASLVPETVPAQPKRAEAGRYDVSTPFGNRLTELMRRLEAEPAVVGATFRASLPGREGVIRVEGLPAPAEHPAGHEVASVGVRPGFAELYGARMLRGRSLQSRDLGEGARAAIVTQAFVRQVLGGGDALGRRIRHVSAEERAGSGETGPLRWYEIIGVMEDLQTNRAAPDLVTPAVYYPVAPSQVQQASLTVRLRGSTPADFASRFRQITAEVDPSLRLGTVRSLADSDRQRQITARLVGLTVGLILLSVLLLSAAGIYAMMSFTVTQRWREIGIRAALGAQPGQVLRSVFSRAAWQIALGLTVGIATAAVIERLTGGGLMSGRGLVLLPALAIIMAVVGLLAALGPARRGLKIQPTDALRADG